MADGRPEVTQLTEDLYAMLPEIYRAGDAAQASGPNAYPLLRWIAGIGDVAEPLDRMYLRLAFVPPADGGPATGPGSTSDLADPLTADEAWLPWLAQALGVRPNTAVPVAVQRDLLASPDARRPGSRKAIAQAARAALVGSQFVQVVDHAKVDGTGSVVAGSQWEVVLLTRTNETPDVDAVLAAVVTAQAKPAGVKLYHAVFASSWATLMTNYPTWTAMHQAYTWGRITGTLIGGDPLGPGTSSSDRSAVDTISTAETVTRQVTSARTASDTRTVTDSATATVTPGTPPLAGEDGNGLLTEAGQPLQA